MNFGRARFCVWPLSAVTAERVYPAETEGSDPPAPQKQALWGLNSTVPHRHEVRVLGYELLSPVHRFHGEGQPALPTGT